MKAMAVIFFGLFFFHSSLLCSQSKSNWTKLKEGLEIIESGLNIYKMVTEDFKKEDDNDIMALVIFSTSSSSNISIYVNGTFVGYVKEGITRPCKVREGHGSYKAVHPNGTSTEDNLYFSSGICHNVFISSQKLNLTYDIKKKECSISGKSVNLRSSPEIDPENIISKLSSYDSGEILDKMIVIGSSDDRIILNETDFQPEDGTSSYKAYKGIAVKLIESYTNGTSKIRLFRKDGTSKTGYISSRELGSMLNKPWYKIRINGYVGWVYGDYVTEGY